MVWRIALAAAALLAGCHFDANHQADGYRCDSQHRCPEGTECEGGVCRAGAGTVDDGAPGGVGGDAGEPTDDGLVAYWPMDDLMEGSTLDATGQHEATCDNCPSLASGRVGGAWRFNGFEDFIRVKNADAFKLARGTLSVWARFEEMNWGALIGKPYGDQDHNSFLIFCNDTLDVRLEVGGAFVDGLDVQLETWVHVVATWSSAGARQLHVSPDQTTSVDDETIVLYDDQDVLIGVDFDPPEFVSYFKGSLDEVRIYDRVLDPEEIDDLYAAGGD